jgi:2-polyprenyl-3-methyl-5-hydroxy-6-metoxy-1,4-benzoquinol methylase
MTLDNSKSIQRQEEALSLSYDHDCITLPPNISEILCRDPKLIGFVAARHKFVAKILEGLDILEIGCQEGFGTLFVAPYVNSITSIDFYPPFVDGFKKYMAPFIPNCNVRVGDITQEFFRGPFDGAFALDVLEHINASEEHHFWNNICKSITPNATAIIGMPSLESQAYASEASKIGHVNCKTGSDLKVAASNFFENVMIFSMNDEMLHNGYLPMSHYIFAVCMGKRAKPTACYADS